MTDKQKIEFLLELLKSEKFSMDLTKAHAFVGAYALLIKMYKEMEE
jgi:hypothetical protein